MKKHIFLTKHLFVVLALLVFMSSCNSQAPIVVYVTPTPDEAAALVVTDVPTLQAPTSTPEVPTATLDTSPATSTPLPEVTIEAPRQNTPVGSVIGGDYILPPTSTPRPTATPLPPTEGPSPEPSATSSEPPTAEPTQAQPIAGALPNLDSARLGIQLDPTLSQDDWNRALDDIQRLGVKWLKVQVSWKQLQPNAAGEISEDFRRLEIYLETAYNKGLDILISVAKAPSWARTNQTEDGPPDDPQALVNFINLMLQEFGTSLDAVEVWNEPNLVREWQGQPLNGQSYMQYFVPAYSAITSYAQSMVNDPKTPRTTPLYVITAGLAPTGNTDGSRDDRTFLQEMYSAGLGQYRDIFIGLHPYGWGNPPDATCCDASDTRGWDDNPHFFFLNNVNDMRDIMIQNGHSEQRMFVTEFGYATWDGFAGDPPQQWMSYTNECQQGVYTIRALEIAQSFDFMGPVILWNLNVANAATVANRDEMAAYSMIIPRDARERAVYWMVYDAVRPNEQLTSYAVCPASTS